MASAAELAIRITAEDMASKAFGNIGKSAEGMGAKAANAGKAIAVGLAAGGVAVAGVGIASIKMASDFQAGMKEVATLSPDIAGNFKEMSAEVNALSSRMGVDAVGSTKALYQAISAGVPADNALSFLEIASKAAIGGVTDTETAVDGITSAVNAFADQGLEAGRAADIMFATVKAGKTDFGQLSGSLANVAPLAATMGVSFEEVSAAMATMTLKGTQTSVASTQVRAALQGLSKPSKELTAIFQESGYASGEAAIKALGFAGAADIVAGATGGSVSKLTALVGSVEGVQGILAVTGEGAETFAGVMDGITNSAGSADAAFETMNEGFGRQMEIMQSKLSGLMITIGSELLPVVTPLITAFGEWLPGAFATITPIIQGFAELVSKVFRGDVTGAFNDLMGVVGRIAPQIAAQLQEWGRQFIAWIAPLIPPMLAEAGRLAARFLGWIASQVGPLLSKLGEWGQQLWAWIGPMIPPLLVEAGKLAGQLLAWIQGQIPGLVTQFAEWARSAINWVADAASDILPKLLEFASSVLDWVIAEAPGLVKTFLTEWLPAAIGWVAQAAVDIIPDLLGLIGTIVTWIATEGVPKMVEGALKLGWALIEGAVQGLWQMAGDLFGAVGNIIGDALSAGQEEADAHSPSRKWMALGRDLMAGLAIGIIDSIPEVEAAVRTAGSAVLDTMEGMTQSLDSLARNTQYQFIRIGEAAGQAINEAIVQASRDISGAISGATSRISELYESRDLNQQLQAVRGAFGLQMRDEDIAYNRQRADEDAEYSYQRDLAKATTADQRQQIEERYRDTLADMARRRKREDEDREWRRQQDEKRDSFNANLEAQALSRQVMRIEEERDSRITAINVALGEKQRMIYEDAENERRTLMESFQNRVADMQTEFVDKLPALTSAAWSIIDAFLARIGEGTATQIANMRELLSLAGGGNKPPSIDWGQSGPIDTMAQYGINPSFLQREDRERLFAHNNSLPLMDSGGVVPGPWGSLQPVMARGGERYSGFPPRGRDSGPITIINRIYLDGRQIAESVTTEQQYARSIG